MEKSKSIKEILEEFQKETIDFCRQHRLVTFDAPDFPPSLIQAVSAICELLHKEMPEKKYYENTEGKEEDGDMQLFNQAISQCHSAIDRVCKGGKF